MSDNISEMQEDLETLDLYSTGYGESVYFDTLH